MANKTKTPGEVAWEAYRSVLVETPDQPATGGYTSPAWEAAAQAVREQLQAEQKESNDAFRKLKHLFHPTPIEALIEIQELIAKWRTIDPDFDTHGVYDNEALETIAAILGEPTPEGGKDGE